MQPEGFDLLYEEGPCLVVAKPGGVLTQAPPGIDSLEVRVKSFLKIRDEKPGGVYLGVPHRLDRPVSGGLIVCKHVRATRQICKQFESRTIEKRYWALVGGRVDLEQGTWTDYMRKIPGVAKAELVDEDHPQAQLAVLRYRLIGAVGNATLLEIELETGRMHQIRLQAARRNHPLLGDELYGSQEPFGPPVADPRDRWIGLHAVRLRFLHPMTREVVDLRVPLPGPWRQIPMPPAPGEESHSVPADGGREDPC